MCPSAPVANHRPGQGPAPCQNDAAPVLENLFFNNSLCICTDSQRMLYTPLNYNCLRRISTHKSMRFQVCMLGIKIHRRLTDSKLRLVAAMDWALRAAAWCCSDPPPTRQASVAVGASACAAFGISLQIDCNC